MPVTNILKCSSVDPDASQILYAVDVLRSGGLVAFPTETVYGLGADALNDDAVQKVFMAKGRPSDNPLIVHIASLENVQQFTEEFPVNAIKLAKRFWPGPLTMVCRRKNSVPDNVTAGLDTVALRVPNHPVTLELLKQFNGGLVGPSANISGKPSPTSAEHVFNDLNGKIDLILDAGPTMIGIESTVLDVTVDPPTILRIGGLSQEALEKEFGQICTTDVKQLLRRSPGTRHRHYAPQAQVVLFSEADEAGYKLLLQKNKAQQKKIGSITYSSKLADIDPSPFHKNIGSSIEQFARSLFQSLRELDQKGVDVILVESVEEKGLGAAVMDRLRKAATNRE